VDVAMRASGEEGKVGGSVYRGGRGLGLDL
jgi:hypothetical protein